VSYLQDAVAHICAQVERNGLEVTEEIKLEVQDLLKERLIKTERDIFNSVLTLYGPAAFPDSKTERIRCYQDGAFNVQYFAPGGILEVGPEGRPVPWERLRCPICVEDNTPHGKICNVKYKERYKK